MNKQPSSTIMTRLCWGVFFLVLLFLGFQVIPRALGQRDASKRSAAAQMPQSATGGLPGTRAPAKPASPKIPAVRQSQLPRFRAWPRAEVGARPRQPMQLNQGALWFASAYDEDNPRHICRLICPLV